MAAHGDDLGYIFEARHLNGTPLPHQEHLTPDDLKVRDVFTEMLSDFARNGKIHIDGAELPAFSSTTNHFLQISAKPKIGDNFRFCEMALWAGLEQRLQDPVCRIISVVRNVPGAVISKVKGLEGVAGNVGGGGGLLNRSRLVRNKGKGPLGFL